MLDFLLRYPALFKYSKLHQRQNEVLGVLHGFADRVITRRRAELSNTGINNNQSPEQISRENDDIGIKKKLAFLDILLQSTINDQALTDLEIREEVDTFMFEVSWIVWMML